MVFSEAYLEHLKLGPFPGRVDPWSEDAHYFQQIHSGMIEDFAKQIGLPVVRMGYVWDRKGRQFTKCRRH